MDKNNNARGQAFINWYSRITLLYAWYINTIFYHSLKISTIYRHDLQAFSSVMIGKPANNPGVFCGRVFRTKMRSICLIRLKMLHSLHVQQGLIPSFKGSTSMKGKNWKRILLGFAILGFGCLFPMGPAFAKSGHHRLHPINLLYKGAFAFLTDDAGPTAVMPSPNKR